MSLRWGGAGKVREPPGGPNARFRPLAGGSGAARAGLLQKPPGNS